MPTKSQLYTIWEAQFEFFGGSGQPKETYIGSSDGHGHITTKLIDTPLISNHNRFITFDGKHIGHIVLDKDNDDFKG